MHLYHTGDLHIDILRRHALLTPSVSDYIDLRSLFVPAADDGSVPPAGDVFKVILAAESAVKVIIGVLLHDGDIVTAEEGAYLRKLKGAVHTGMSLEIRGEEEGVPSGAVA